GTMKDNHRVSHARVHALRADVERMIPLVLQVMRQTKARLFFFKGHAPHRDLRSFPTRRSSDLLQHRESPGALHHLGGQALHHARSEEHTSELQSLTNLVCRLLLEKKKNKSWPRPRGSHRRSNRASRRARMGMLSSAWMPRLESC